MKLRARYVEYDGRAFLMRVWPDTDRPVLWATYCEGSYAVPVRPITWEPGLRIACPICHRLCGVGRKNGGKVWAHYRIDQLRGTLGGS